jgi:hypothetical protein
MVHIFIKWSIDKRVIQVVLLFDITVYQVFFAWIQFLLCSRRHLNRGKYIRVNLMQVSYFKTELSLFARTGK